MKHQGKLDPAIQEFVAEGREIIDRVLKLLASFDAGEVSQDRLSSLYRDVHTLKGSSQLFGFKQMAQVSHALEASLDPIRKGKMHPESALMEACTESVGLLEEILGGIEKSGEESVLPERLIHVVTQLIDIATDGVNLSVDKESVGEFVRRIKSIEANADLTNEVKDEEALEKTLGGAGFLPSVSEPTIRVHVSLLDRILNLVGELVLVRNQLVQHRHRIDDVDFLNTSKSLDVVTSDLQSEVMKTRMQPIDTVVARFQRVVKDIARDLGKKIDLTLEGADTELDKSLLEAIKDPLNHIVRNSCDHGIETPENRKLANKPDTGHLLIRSFHEGGQVVIEVSDDGRGIRRKEVLKKAIEKGLLNEEKASKLSDREVCDLIFLPGFSTTSEVTAVSGRGVGMDVVKTNIEKIGGSVEVKSVEGKGTSIQMRIPLTLAIVPALIVRCGQGRYAIPQVKLVELVHVDGKTTGQGQIEKLQDRPMFRLRGHLLPLYDLRDITGNTYDQEYHEEVFIVVLSTEGETFGLLVPQVLDTADIVVKPLTNMLNNLQAFSGATILGDGSIALILDIRGLAEYGCVLNKRSQKEERESFSKQERARISADVQEFLLFSVGTDALHALPLCLVNRLEEFSVEAIEHSGQQEVVRYRGALLPLINVAQALRYSSPRPMKGHGQDISSERLSVIVVQRSGRNYGLVVRQIVDVMTIDSLIDDSIRDRNGILGNLIHNDEVRVVIDALGMIESFNRTISGKAASSVAESRDVMRELRNLNKEMKLKSIRVLYAEDVAFFRKHVSSVLADAGIDITTVEDGEKALQELEASDPDRYNLVLSDIEMPNMDGLELARQIKRRPKLRHLPLIALTTRFREDDVREGELAGFTGYLEKLNPEKLLEVIFEIMGAKAGTRLDSAPSSDLRERV